MGVVYLARDLDSGTKVALKVLPPELTRNIKYVERFRREAQAVSHLEHPNIIKVYEIGEQDGVHYFAMEYLGGPNLRTLLKERKRISVPEAVQIIVQIADALDLAHSRGVVHRDVKPDNIMANEDGVFKIMDFGIAHTEEGTRLTVTGTIMGTPEYMSPEQASGTAVDRRTDIYALGIVLYEMLTGKVPFRGDTAIEVLQMHLTKIPESPKLLNPEIPGNLASVIAKMIEKQAANRYDSFRHVINALSQAMPDSMRTTIGVAVKDIKPKVDRLKEGRGPRVRERIIIQTPAAVRVALAASMILNIALFGYFLFRPASAKEKREPVRPAFAIGGQTFAPPAVSDGTLFLASEEGSLYAYDLHSGNAKWSFRAGDKITAAPLVDRNRVYIGSWDQHVYALDAADNGKLIWKANAGGCVFATPVLSNGTLYVCTREGKVLAIDAETGAEKWKDDTKSATRFSPTLCGSALLVPSDERRLFAYEAADGSRIGNLATDRVKSPVVAAGREFYLVTFKDSTGQDELSAFQMEKQSGQEFQFGKPRVTALNASAPTE